MKILDRLKKASPSKILIFIIILVVFIIDFNNVSTFKKRLMSISDVQQYYAYLPAAFIFKDLTLSYSVPDTEYNIVYVWGVPASTGKAVIMTSMGLSILYSPTFFLSHLAAKMLGYDTNGYSQPYFVGLQFNLIFYLMIGLLFLRKVLRKYFNETITFLTILTLFFGTNLFHYATYDSALAHAYEFSLAAVFVYYTIKWYEIPRLKYTFLIGCLSGLISLIRPTDIVILLFFILWKVINLETLRERTYFFIKKWYLILIMVFFFLLVWAPQLLYWKSITGQYLFYSYNSESYFDFLSPHIIKGLFSYTKGWFVYTPIMLFAMAGIVVVFRKYKEWFIALFIYTIVNIYVVLSWHCWYYGGSFGLRAFIDSYSILAFPLAAFIAWFFNNRLLLRFGFLLIFCLLIFFNLFQSAQYRQGAIHYAFMTKKAYWETFLKLKPTQDFYKYLSDPMQENN
jgi:hypothetical protein